ncbi:MAG: glutathione S-transferase family protein [Gammaproteobacteria bacterium]|nr:glutathione S-transferase family protein [Gammaproteobacteria bacterium]MCW9004097.1 glutathione S-transferase family protein [Gammaproteobacteria bacterium]MCW9056004.1 glutathione S-transferase family protein [Gammaproteobacteria bacterium]
MSKLTLIIGNKNYSSWSLRPWVFLKQKQIAFDEKRVALFTQTTDKELAEYNSDSKVPVLKDGDLVIWDSLSILEYIAEKYPHVNGWPVEQDARAFARSVSCEMHSSFFSVRNELPMNCRKKFKNIQLSSDAEREIERIRNLWRQCRTQFGQQGKWLFGEYSIADAMFAPVALRFAGYGISLDGIEADYVTCVLNQACIINWIEAGKKEKEVIEEDEINV